MTEKNIEMMQKIIEEKKMKGSQGNTGKRADKTLGQLKGAHRSSKKTGGLFDK